MNPESTETKSNFSKEALTAVLFYVGEPISVKRLSTMFGVSSDQINQVSLELKDSLASLGLSLIIHNDEIQMVTHPSHHEIIEKLRKEDLTKELSKAALETLSIILYKQELTRLDIDFIRGVNSSFILRNLLVRGLIVRKDNPNDARTFLYTASHDLFSYLGVSSSRDLPDFERVDSLLKERIDALSEGAES